VFEFTYGTTEDKDDMESRFQPCFVDEIRSLKRFQEFTTANVVGQFQAWFRGGQRLSELRCGINSDDKMLESLIVDVMTSCARDDIRQLLPALSKSLDEIELSLHDDVKLQSSVTSWRDLLGRWRNMIFHQEKTLRAFHQQLSTRIEGPAGSRIVDPESFGALASELRETRLRIDNVFQSLMSAMSIVESKEAIREAKGVSKLTQLAFFFIPLSLVSSAFGMNVKVGYARDTRFCPFQQQADKSKSQ